MIKIQNYIGGELHDSCSGKKFDVIAPGSGQIYGFAPRSNTEDANMAFHAAKSAFEGWKSLPVEKRSAYLRAIADGIETEAKSFAKAESQDSGKPLWLCEKVDIPRASKNFRFFADTIQNYHGDSFQRGGYQFDYTLNEPLGPVTCISPWNLPLYLFSWKIAPALASGCTVVAKPSEVTPLTAYLLSKVCQDVQLPAGVLNVIHGLGAEIGAAVVEHPHTKAVSFTGGTETGKTIARSCADRFIPTSLELGGKNPAVVFKDANIEKSAKEIVRSSFTNQGQICLCSSRILIAREVYEDFSNLFKKHTSELVVGPPSAPSSNLGAVVSLEHKEKIMGFIDAANNSGALISLGEHHPSVDPSLQDDTWKNGYYVYPTIIENLPNDHLVNQQEIFGPVVTLQPFDSYDHAIKLANECAYGLSATIWTDNLETAHRAAADLQAGVIWINSWLERDLRTPFGGHKQSGLGKEGGMHALDFFHQRKNVSLTISSS